MIASERTDRGAAMILVAVALLALMGIAAIAIDGGVAYGERRSTQNSADNAALAAALAACTAGDVPAAATTSASTNGYETSSVQVTHPFDGIELTDGPIDPNRTVLVEITGEVENTFGRTQGVASTDVVSEAVATCSLGTGLGPVALFAKGPSCDLTKGGKADITGFSYSAGDMTWNGGGAQVFDGSMHADGFLTVNGPPLNITGSATATDGSNSADVTLTPPLDLPYPVEYSIDDYRPGSAKANTASGLGEYYLYEGGATPTSSDLGRDGIHFVDGDVKVAGPPQNSDITLVATGTIEIRSTHTFRPYDDGLAIMSGADTGCGLAIDIRGSSDMRGVIFAPRGGIEIFGSSVNGAVIGLDIDTGGSLVVTADPDLVEGVPPEVLLLG